MAHFVRPSRLSGELTWVYNSILGPIELVTFDLYFDFHGKFWQLPFHFWSPFCYNFLHMPWKLCCLACAKFFSNHFIRIWMKANGNFYLILIMMENSWVKWSLPAGAGIHIGQWMEIDWGSRWCRLLEIWNGNLLNGVQWHYNFIIFLCANKWHCIASVLILGLCPGNERCHYKVMSLLIGWA